METNPSPAAQTRRIKDVLGSFSTVQSSVSAEGTVSYVEAGIQRASAEAAKLQEAGFATWVERGRIVVASPTVARRHVNRGMFVLPEA